MALGGCYSCIKYLMFAFNFLFWAAGCIVLGVGIWLLVDPNINDRISAASEKSVDLTVFDPTTVKNVAIVFIVVGSAIMVLGFLGCCGAIRESQCMLATFFVLLLIIFAVLLAAGIIIAMYKDTIRTKVDENLKNLNSTKDRDVIQKTWECHIAGKEEKNGVTPGSSQNCSDKIVELAQKYAFIAAGVAIGIALIMLLGMVFSMLLCCAIKETA